MGFFGNGVVVDAQKFLDHLNALRFVRPVKSDALGKSAQKAHDRLGLFPDEPLRCRDIIVRIGKPKSGGVGELAKTLLTGEQRVRRIDERAVHGSAQQSANSLALVADLHQGGFLGRFHSEPGQNVARGKIGRAAEARDGDFASLELSAVLDFVVDVQTEGHGGRVGGDKEVSRSLHPRSLRGGAAAAADHLHVAGEQNLKRLASALEKNEINVQPVAFERAGFLGDIQEIDAAAYARQAKEDLLLSLGRKRGGIQQKEQKRKRLLVSWIFLSVLSSR